MVRCPKVHTLVDNCSNSSTVHNMVYENYSGNQCLTWLFTVLGFESVLKGGKRVWALINISQSQWLILKSRQDFNSKTSRSNIPFGSEECVSFFLQEGHKEGREKHNSYILQPEFHRSQWCQPRDSRVCDLPRGKRQPQAARGIVQCLGSSFCPLKEETQCSLVCSYESFLTAIF